MENIDYSSNINSIKLNEELISLQNLAKDAFKTNYELAKVIKAHALAVETLGSSIESASAQAGQFLQLSTYTPSTAAKVIGVPFSIKGSSLSNAHITSTDDAILGFGIKKSRIPFADGKLSKLAQVNMQTNKDETLPWIFEPEYFWSNSFSSPSVTIKCFFPPTHSNDINYVKFENLFPSGISHTIRLFDTSGTYKDFKGTSSSFYPVDMINFSGYMDIILDSELTKDSAFVFGIKNVEMGHLTYKDTGYIVHAVELPDKSSADIVSFGAQFKTAQTPLTLSDYLSFQIGTAFDGNDISSIVYDSSTDVFPLKEADPDVNISSITNNTIYVKTILNKIKSTPAVTGFYLEYK